jgi:hypothetical protein
MNFLGPPRRRNGQLRDILALRELTDIDGVARTNRRGNLSRMVGNRAEDDARPAGENRIRGLGMITRGQPIPNDRNNLRIILDDQNNCKNLSVHFGSTYTL